MLQPLSERGKAILDELVWQLGDQLGVKLTYERIDPEEREKKEKEEKEEKEEKATTL